MNVEIEADFLEALRKARGQLTQDQTDLLVALCVAPDNEATATQLAPLFGYTKHTPVNSLMARLARVLAEAGEIEPPKREDGSIRWWQVVATGWRKDASNFPWKLRPGWRDAAVQLGMVPSDTGLFPEVVPSGSPLLEGAVTRVTANAYERNPVARRRCIEHYGTRCTVCAFDFGETYGPIAEGVIHVHHLRPICNAGGEYAVDPIQDLRPVCANCHLVIHRRDPPLEVDEARALLHRNEGP